MYHVTRARLTTAQDQSKEINTTLTIVVLGLLRHFYSQLQSSVRFPKDYKHASKYQKTKQGGY